MRGRTKDIADDATATPSGKSEARRQLEQVLEELERPLHRTDESRAASASANEGVGDETIKLRYLVQLRDALIKHFDVARFRDLCFELGRRLEDELGIEGLSYEDLLGDLIDAKATELVAYCDRHNCISELAKEINCYHPGSVSYPPPEAVKRASSRTQSLPTVLATRFNEGELRTLCFELGVHYDALRGDCVSDKARELVDYLYRRGRIRELVETGKRLRPKVSWDDALEVSNPPLSQLYRSLPKHSSKDREPEADSVTASPGSQPSSPQHSQPEHGSGSAISEGDKRSRRRKIDHGIRFVDLLPLGLKLGPFIADSLRTFFEAKPKDPQEIAASQIQLLNAYYLLALKQARRSFLWALVAAVVGLTFFIASVVFLLAQRSQDVAIAGMISGALVQVISGINFYLYGKASSQLADFRTSLDTTQRFLLANSICEGVEGNLKTQARSHLVLAVAGTDATFSSQQASTSAQPSPPPQTPVPSQPDAPSLVSDVHIAYIDYNPPGEDVEGEYVRIRNSGGVPACLTNWTLRDKVGHEFIFPPFILEPGAYVRVWTKAGTNNLTNLYWGRKQAVWNNMGDCAYLRDDAETVIDEYCYSAPAPDD